MELLPGLNAVRTLYKCKESSKLPHIIFLKPKTFSPEFYFLAQLCRMPVWNEVYQWLNANMQPLDWTTEWHSKSATPVRLFKFQTKNQAFMFKLTWC
jgi:hypothetical protein